MKSINHADDAAQLAALGHTAELQRNFSPLWVRGMWTLDLSSSWLEYGAMLGLAFAILNVRLTTCEEKLNSLQLASRGQHWRQAYRSRYQAVDRHQSSGVCPFEKCWQAEALLIWRIWSRVDYGWNLQLVLGSIFSRVPICIPYVGYLERSTRSSYTNYEQSWWPGEFPT